MTIKVTKPKVERKFTKDVQLYTLVGKTSEYDEFILDPDIIGKFIPFGDYDLKQHTLQKDILVYFPEIDFCYWLATGEYDVL